MVAYAIMDIYVKTEKLLLKNRFDCHSIDSEDH